ncbi:MAG: glycoside hydrolase family 88 protein [Verrucomicrobia bacterium]|nr:glycoside hydrolase family 88 protein [Verrucomicrobiota bacterium]
MAIKIDARLTPQKLLPKITRLFELSAEKILSLEKTWDSSKGTPVFTVKGQYTSRGWTEWTQGFQFGSALLQFDATGDTRLLEMGRRKTVELMATHVSHVGVHDHGFNNISTYGNLLRLMREGKLPFNEREKDFYELALKVSGAVQAARWSTTADGAGYIYSFNGPHSLFIDTMRSLRSLGVAHQLGHVLMGERDQKISLLQRLVEHAATTAKYNVYYGESHDAYDVRGRTAHESIFNRNDGSYRCPSSQQGYSPFSTWMRGLAWAMCGFAEQLEFFETISDEDLDTATRHDAVPREHNLFLQSMIKAALATADFYLENTCTDGIPMWDTGAPNLHRLGGYLGKPADPFNPWEPVDSSAAAIAAQGLVRLGNYLTEKGQKKSGARYRQAGLTVADTIFGEPYLSIHARHQGLLLHSVYHRPNGWDHIARGQKVPNGESSMWGDYHLRELALLLWREARHEPYLTFFDSRPEPQPGR